MTADRAGRLTAHTLNSGCSESGSTASLVSALMVRYSPCSSFQWNGTKQLPGRTRSVTTAGSTARPRRDVSSTGWPSTMPSASASTGMDLDERPAVELVELVDLAGLGHGVPLVLQPAGVEHHREVVVGQLGGVHVRAGVKHRAPRRGRERQPGRVPVLVDEQVLADAVVEVADRVAVAAVVRRARPLQRGLRAAARSWRREGRSRSWDWGTGGSRRRSPRWTCSRKCSPKPRCAATWQISCQSGRACPAAGSTAAAGSGCARS